MRLLYDQNLSYRLVAELQDLYPDSLHVRDIGMKDSACTTSNSTGLPCATVSTSV